ncbi:MAG: hypothetical protein WBD31_29660 [Rubripirellula sp.]
MKSYRTLTVYITLVALLLGNAAGWVHVGCSHQASSCCAVDSGGSRKAASLRTSSKEPVGHACCHHRQDGSCHSKATADTADSGTSDSSLPAEPHDSDGCAVCQSFFASRNAVTLVDSVLAIERLAVSRKVVFLDDVIAPNHQSPSHTVRGPPSV